MIKPMSHSLGKELFRAVGQTIPIIREEIQKATPKPAAPKAAKKGKGKKK